MNRNAILVSTFLTSTALMTPVGAWAQTTTAASAAPQTGGIEDIVVTARRVEESLQTTPVAVTAVTAAMLQSKQVNNSLDLQRTAPGLVIATGSASNTGFTFVSIRGQGNLTPIIANDPAVATYVDGVYIARPSQGITDFHDIERIEVLRGPQGTLFGRNTTGGALNILTADPTSDLEFKIRGEAGNFAYKKIGVTANVPVTENLSARVTYNFSDRNGYGKNRTLDLDVADNKSKFVRGKLRYDGNGFDITLSGDYNKIQDHNQFIGLKAYNLLLPAAAGGGFIVANQAAFAAALHTRANWYSTYGGALVTPSTNPLFARFPANVQAMYRRKPFNDLEAYGFSGTINIDLGFANLKSITGYRRLVTDGLNDTDATPVPALATFGGSASKQLSQELQLSGDITDQLSYILGGYASRETGYEYSYSQVFGGLLRNNFGTAENITKGLYAQAYYKLTDTLRLTGGFRYTWDTRNSVLKNRALLGLPGDFVTATSAAGVPTYNCSNTGVVATPLAGRAAVAALCEQPQDTKFSYPAWTAGVDWQASDEVFVYLKTSGAAKAGGWNLRAGSLPAFNPEKVKDVEGGIKTDLFDRRLRANVAVFHTWKSAVQAVVNAFVPNVGVTQYIQNNGDARIWGAEFEVTAIPWEGMELNANLSLQDGKYVPGSFTELQRITSATPLAGCAPVAGTSQYDCVSDLSGETLPQLPKRQFNIGATQILPAGNGEFSFHVDYAYVSSQRFNSAVAAPQQPATVQAQYAVEESLNRIDGYGLVNGRIGYTLHDPAIEIYVFGRNLLDKKYLVRSFSDLYRQIGFAVEYPGADRMYGVGISWKFGG